MVTDKVAGNNEAEFYKLYKKVALQKGYRFHCNLINECQDERSNYKLVLFLPRRGHICVH
jgi:hypothetical protein